jgi:hypothetical protein
MHQSAIAATALSFLWFSLIAATDSMGHDSAVGTRASGTFEVKLAPLSTTHGNDQQLGRISIDKTFQGDFVGTGKGEMLTAATSVKNSAVYVAIERVTGTLHGKRGTFVLHHQGIMDRGGQQLTISVVPDSGTDELAGITGSMKIIIADGKHSYELEYTLAKTP